MERDPLRLIPTMDSDTLLFPSDLPLVWTPSPTDSSTERGLLMLRLIPSTDSDTTLLLLFPSDPPLVWTPLPRDWMPLPRALLLMLMDTTDTDTTDSSMERGLLMLRLIPSTDSDTTLLPPFPSDPPLV